MTELTHTGSCLCGGVQYKLHGKLRPIINCFCGQCQKTSGHHFAATRVDTDRFELTKDETLSWYRSSDSAERGFCQRCGGNLFWRRHADDGISVTAGTMDDTAGLPTSHNIFVEAASDYQYIPPVESNEGKV